MEMSLVVRAGQAFDGERFHGGGLQVHVDGGRIVAVRPPGAPLPEGWPVLDRPDATVLPGLIDTHVHLVAGGEPDALALDAERGGADRARVMRRSLMEQLAAGVTTVRDLGDHRYSVLDRTPGDDEPRVVASGPPLTTPGGHCAALGGEATVEDFPAAIARRHERGARIIKIMAGGGAMTRGSDLLRPQFDADAIRTAVEEAHRWGLPLAAHAHSLASVEACLAGGADTIEHCTCLTTAGVQTPDRVVDGLAARRVQVCPTLGRLPHLPPAPQAVEVMRRTGMTLEARFAQIGRFHAAGVPLLAGSDAGIHPGKPHGVLAHSVSELVSSGLPVASAVAAATSLAAEVCGLGDQVGRLRPGMLADILVVSGDLSTDVTALTRVRDVILRGRPVNAGTASGPGSESGTRKESGTRTEE